MKIPKIIKMFGYKWKVVLNNKVGGSFVWETKTITLNKDHAEEILLHELMEAVLVHLNYRFYGQEQGMELTFHFNHTGLCNVHKQFFQILKDNKLI